jgi:hypothetical protein
MWISSVTGISYLVKIQKIEFSTEARLLALEFFDKE